MGNNQHSRPSIVRQYREKLGYTQQALGEHLGYKEQTIRSWEAGRRKPPALVLKTLEKMAK